MPSENWVFTLDEDHVWKSPLSFEADAAFEDRTGRRWLEVRTDGTIRVLAGYSWDGCTPKVFLWQVFAGIPDGIVDARTRRPKTYHASLIHDVLYQFLDDGLGVSRAEADRCFLLLMEDTGFRLRGVYYRAVRLLGWLFRGLGKLMRGTRGRKVVLGNR